AASPDGKHLYSVARGQSSIWEWDLASRAVTRKLSGAVREAVSLLGISTGGEVLVGTGDRSRISIIPLSQQEPARVPQEVNDEGTRESFYCERTALALSHDGRLVAAHVGNRYALQNAFQIWSLPDGKKVSHFSSAARTYHALAFSPDSRTLAAAEAR